MDREDVDKQPKWSDNEAVCGIKTRTRHGGNSTYRVMSICSGRLSCSPGSLHYPSVLFQEGPGRALRLF